MAMSPYFASPHSHLDHAINIFCLDVSFPLFFTFLFLFPPRCACCLRRIRNCWKRSTPVPPRKERSSNSPPLRPKEKTCTASTTTHGRSPSTRCVFEALCFSVFVRTTRRSLYQYHEQILVSCTYLHCFKHLSYRCLSFRST